MLIHEAFVYLHVRNAAAALRFYSEVFDARETLRIDMPDGRIGHAEMRIGPMVIMLADEFPERGVQSPLAFGGSGTTMHLHVDDVDALARRAWDAGAMILREPTDEEHGERQCRLRDPFGHEWLLGQEIVPMSDEDIKRIYETSSVGRVAASQQHG